MISAKENIHEALKILPKKRVNKFCAKSPKGESSQATLMESPLNIFF